MPDIKPGTVFNTGTDIGCVALDKPEYHMFQALDPDRKVYTYTVGMVTEVTGQCDLDKLLDSLIYG